MTETRTPELDFDPARDGHAAIRGGSLQQAIIVIKRWALEQEGDFLVLAPWATDPPRPHWTQVTQPISWAHHLIAAGDEMAARY
jgi:hypothetical protein